MTVRSEENLQFPGQSSWTSSSSFPFSFHQVNLVLHDACRESAKCRDSSRKLTPLEFLHPFAGDRFFVASIDSHRPIFSLFRGSIFFATTILATRLIPLILVSTIINATIATRTLHVQRQFRCSTA